MKSLLVLSLVLASTSALAGVGTSSTNAPFPTSPDPILTPGSLCDKPDSKRYPEAIPYCTRAVEGTLKREIIQNYDDKLAYQITTMNRSDFKIDHYIPLCMGGSNYTTNLWPQHKSVYVITDLIEQVACNKMAEGKLRQADAVAYIKRAKANLNEAPAITKEIQGL